MASPEEAPHLPPGTYAPPTPTSLRSPCPILNALSNHGHLPRSGRSITHSQFLTSLTHLGISHPIRWTLTHAALLPHTATPPTGLLAFLRHPLSYILRRFGMRDPGQHDRSGSACLNLDQLARHAAVEHDVSLSRRDFAQGDNHSPDPALVRLLLAASSDGRVVSATDFAALRRRRLQQQRRDNPELEYGSLQHGLACGEAAFLLALFDAGGGEGVPVEWLRALFVEERLPLREGWRRRSGWWPWWGAGELGFGELTVRAEGVRWRVGRIDKVE